MKKSYKRQQGVGIIKTIVLTPFVIIGLVIFLFIYTEINKAYWDHRVAELCEKDGGAVVFERVILTKEEYELNDGRKGVINVMSEDTSKTTHQYAWKSITKIINEKKPYVRRTEYVTYRKSDNEKLGLLITYSRRGGDFPTVISHPSSFSCKDIIGFEQDLNINIFIFKGE